MCNCNCCVHSVEMLETSRPAFSSSTKRKKVSNTKAGNYTG